MGALLYATNLRPFSMFFLSSGIAASTSFCSTDEMSPSGWIFSTPLGYKYTRQYP